LPYRAILHDWKVLEYAAICRRLGPIERDIYKVGAHCVDSEVLALTVFPARQKLICHCPKRGKADA
jgi:hypothetical protein